MSFIESALRWISGLQSIVLVPLAILIISLIARMKFGRAFRAAVTIGAGLVGLFAMVNVFGSAVGPAIQGFAKATGIQRDVADLGVFTLLVTTWGSKIAIWFIPVGLVVNLVMLALNWTSLCDQ